MTILLTTLTFQKSYAVDAEELPKINTRLVDRALDVCQLVRVNDGFTQKGRLSGCAMQPLQLALNVFIDMNHEHKYDREINELCVILCAMGRRMPFVMSLVRMIQLDVQRRSIELPFLATRTLDEFERDDVAKDKLPNSIFPYTRSAATVGNKEELPQGSVVDRLNMGEFLELFERLATNE